MAMNILKTVKCGILAKVRDLIEVEKCEELKQTESENVSDLETKDFFELNVDNEEKEKEEDEILKQLRSENEELCEQIFELVGITKDNPITTDLKSLKAKNLELKRHLEQITMELNYYFAPEKTEKEKEIEWWKQFVVQTIDEDFKVNLQAFIAIVEGGSLDGHEGRLVAFHNGSFIPRTFESEYHFIAYQPTDDQITYQLFTVPGGENEEYVSTSSYCNATDYSHNSNRFNEFRQKFSESIQTLSRKISKFPNNFQRK